MAIGDKIQFVDKAYVDAIKAKVEDAVDGSIQEVLDSEIVATDIANKLMALETEYIPRLAGVESSLAEIAEQTIRPKTKGLLLNGTTEESDKFQTLLDELDTVHYKYNVILNKKDILLFNKTLKIPSNVRIFGGGTLKTTSDAFTLDNVWNPAMIINKKSLTNPETDDINIILDGINIEANFYTISSVIRFSGIDTFEIKDCNIKISTTPVIKHNLSVDIFANAKNGKIHGNNIFINSGASPIGCGGLAIRNNLNNGEIRFATKNIQIFNNTINSDGHDELLYISSNGGDVHNINVYNNYFIRRTGSAEGVGITVSAEYEAGGINVSNISIVDNTVYFEQLIATQSAIRIGVFGETKATQNIIIKRNLVHGLIGNIGIQNVIGNSVVINDNTIINESDLPTGQGIVGDWGGKETICENNLIRNFSVGITKCWKPKNNKVMGCNIGIDSYDQCTENDIIGCIQYGIRVIGQGWMVFPYIEGNYINMFSGNAIACILLVGNSGLVNAKILNNSLIAPTDNSKVTAGILGQTDTAIEKPLVENNEILVPSTEITIRCYRAKNYAAHGILLDYIDWRSPIFKTYLGQTVFNYTSGKPLWLKAEGKGEVSTLTITSGVTTSGTITITLGGTIVGVEVTTGDTISMIDAKIRATAFKGYVVTGTVGSGVIVFTCATCGILTAPSFTDTDTTGIIASIVVTTIGIANTWVDATGVSV